VEIIGAPPVTAPATADEILHHLAIRLWSRVQPLPGRTQARIGGVQLQRFAVAAQSGEDRVRMFRCGQRGDPVGRDIWGEHRRAVTGGQSR